MYFQYFLSCHVYHSKLWINNKLVIFLRPKSRSSVFNSFNIERLIPIFISRYAPGRNAQITSFSFIYWCSDSLTLLQGYIERMTGYIIAWWPSTWRDQWNMGRCGSRERHGYRGSDGSTFLSSFSSSSVLEPNLYLRT